LTAGFELAWEDTTMAQGERLRDGREAVRPGPPSGDTDGRALGSLREAGKRFLRAGDRAINQALSGDSESFLRASRQEGGQ
jgi:hypothetical protein